MNINMDLSMMISLILAVGSGFGSYFMLKTNVKNLGERMAKLEEDMDDGSNNTAANLDKHISAVNKTINDRIDGCKKRIDGITIKLEKVEDKLENEINEKVLDIKTDTEKKIKLIFDKIDIIRDAISKLEKELGRIDIRISGNDSKLGQLENLNGIGGDIGIIRKELEYLSKYTDNINNRVEKVIEKIIIKD